MATSCVRLAAIHPFHHQQTFRKPKRRLSSLPKAYVHANIAPSLIRTSCSFHDLLPITGQKHKHQFLSPKTLHNPFASSSKTISSSTICMATTSCENTPKIPVAEICMLVIVYIIPFLSRLNLVSKFPVLRYAMSPIMPLLGFYQSIPTVALIAFLGLFIGIVRYRNSTKFKYSLVMDCVVVIASLVRPFLVNPGPLAGALEFKLQLLNVLELLGFQTCVHSFSEYLGSNTTNHEIGSNTTTNHEMSTLSPLLLPSESGSQWIYETVKGCHEFKIQGYSLAKGKGVGKSMISGIFTVGGYDWVIQFYPDGISESYKEYVSLFVKLSSAKQVRALFKFKLVNQTGKGIHSPPKGPESPSTFDSEDTSSWGYNQFMKRSELETSSYLKNDCLSIHCTVEVVEHRFETVQTNIIPVPPSDMIQNLKGLLESETGSDVTFQVDNEFFRGHKSILAARSPVFRTQFFGLESNPDMETIVIEEFDPFAFKAMLLFLYSDELPEPRELSDPLCTSITIMQHLLAAADRFDLARLRLMCEAKLCEEITANTVATSLALAEQHQCLQLKTACFNFAAKPENLGEIMKSDGFAYLEKSYPSLSIDLLKTSVVDKNLG